MEINDILEFNLRDIEGEFESVDKFVSSNERDKAVHGLGK